jgi:hypothetical protein
MHALPEVSMTNLLSLSATFLKFRMSGIALERETVIDKVIEVLLNIYILTVKEGSIETIYFQSFIFFFFQLISFFFNSSYINLFE